MMKSILWKEIENGLNIFYNKANESRQIGCVSLSKKIEQRTLQQICRSQIWFRQESALEQRNKETIFGNACLTKDWRVKYDQLVINTLKEVQEVDEKTFNFKDYIVKASE